MLCHSWCCKPFASQRGSAGRTAMRNPFPRASAKAKIRSPRHWNPNMELIGEEGDHLHLIVRVAPPAPR